MFSKTLVFRGRYAVLAGVSTLSGQSLYLGIVSFLKNFKTLPRRRLKYIGVSAN